MKVSIDKSDVQGKVTVPSSKSMTIRALMCAALAVGERRAAAGERSEVEGGQGEVAERQAAAARWLEAAAAGAAALGAAAAEQEAVALVERAGRETLGPPVRVEAGTPAQYRRVARAALPAAIARHRPLRVRCLAGLRCRARRQEAATPRRSQSPPLLTW